MHNVNDCSEARCPIQFTLEMVGGKWAILILRELFVSSRRTHEFIEALPGISTKTLTARLRELERHGIVERRVYPEVPPRVEYSLTDKGREIQPVMAALKHLGERWLPQEACHCPMDLEIALAEESLPDPISA
ncbi:MAG: helix-turn-helix domain-containing protein [Cyanobacteria bacterium]|jgi:DNA-binding HxlR family transcriptional regulator|nr:helix-turn-helix domain-containing protein [Cyanobacteriota bacterium]